MLDEEEETLSGLARPSDDRVSDLGLLTAEVLSKVVSGNGLLAEPEVLLSEAESAALMISPMFMAMTISPTYFFRPGAL